jgi:hypothetical protein
LIFSEHLDKTPALIHNRRITITIANRHKTGNWHSLLIALFSLLFATGSIALHEILQKIRNHRLIFAFLAGVVFTGILAGLLWLGLQGQVLINNIFPYWRG